MIDLKNTYIENKEGELRDLWVGECINQGASDKYRHQEQFRNTWPYLAISMSGCIVGFGGETGGLVKIKISDFSDKKEPSHKLKTSLDYLSECAEVQKQRGEQYDKSGTGERSFAACAAAFNAITGRDLKGSDICLILECLKNIRQYSDPTRLHEDSLLDKVSYASLHAEELNKELLGGKNEK